MCFPFGDELHRKVYHHAIETPPHVSMAYRVSAGVATW